MLSWFKLDRINTCLMSNLLRVQRESKGPRAELQFSWIKSQMLSEHDTWYMLFNLKNNNRKTYIMENFIFWLNVYNTFISAATCNSLFSVSILMLIGNITNKEVKMFKTR